MNKYVLAYVGIGQRFFQAKYNCPEFKQDSRLAANYQGNKTMEPLVVDG